MYNIFFLGTALSLAIFVLSIGVLIFLSEKKRDIPQDIVSSVDEDNIEEIGKTPFKQTLKEFTEKYRWEILLGGVFLLIIIFAWIYAPPRLNGKIAFYPNTPGRPFYNLRWGKDFIRINYNALWSWGSAITSVILLIIAVPIIKKRSRVGAEFILLAASINLAALGQWIILIERPPVKEMPVLGQSLYFISIVGFVIWGWVSRKRLRVAINVSKEPIKKSTEITFLLALLLITSFARLYTLRVIPYGIEGDEAKWTSEAVNLGLLGTPDSSGEYHRDALPVSYYIQMPLHRLLGPSLFAARLTVVILSIIGTLLFYWLLRQITNFPIAAISSSLLSISVFDISASRLANVESFAKITPILTLALLAWAIKSRRWQVYGFSGIALAFGMLTYDTVWPLSILTLLIALIELARQKEKFIESVKAIAALLAPTIISLPLLIPYLSSRLSYYKFEEKGLSTDTNMLLWKVFLQVIRTWFIDLRSDFIYNRSGPLLNAVFLPFLVLGLIIAILQIKKKASYWNLLWAILFIFPIPILAHSPMGRVYYPALPAVYFFVGLGFYFFWMELDAFLGKKLRPLLLVVTLLPLTWLPLANLYLYFNEVSDNSDRQFRREIGEFAAQIADEESLLLLPAIPGENTPLNNEHQMLELYMLKSISAEKIDSAYKHVSPEYLLTEIKKQKDSYKNIEILFDQGETPEILNMLRACYPDGKIAEGDFLTRFRLERTDLESIGCISASLYIEVDGENKIYWELKGEKIQEIILSCDNQADDIIKLEAENLFMSPGWQTETNYASDWIGTGFARDNYGSKALKIRTETRLSKVAYIWIRYFKRTLEEPSIYLEVDEDQHPFANITAEELNKWRWERVGPVEFDKYIEFSIDHKGSSEHFMAIFLDSFIISTDANFSPERNLWQSANPLVFSFDTPKNEGTIELEIPQGLYKCQASIENEIPIVEMQGETLLRSNLIEVEIR